MSARAASGRVGGDEHGLAMAFGARRLRAVLLALALVVLAACKRSYAIGDHVLVEWEGQNYPAKVIDAPAAAKFKVHYDGYDDSWDEVVPRGRIKGLVTGPVVQPPPPAKVRAKALKAAQSNYYKGGERVRVEWHGQMYPAVIAGIVGHELYKIHYEGYGNEWDEIVPRSRIQSK